MKLWSEICCGDANAIYSAVINGPFGILLTDPVRGNDIICLFLKASLKLWAIKFYNYIKLL